jgi:AraC-like DNA-binding protein
MSPVAYDRLCRLSLARRALRGGGGAAGTVAAAARDCGFPDTGRFAIDYRRAFGETPSATVRRGSR